MPAMPTFYQPFQPTLTSSGLVRFGLTLDQSPPCRALSGIVHSYLQIDAKNPTPYPVIPDGTQSMFISSRTSRIGGAQSVLRELLLPDPAQYFGIRFYPGALRHFFDLDLADITDAYADPNYIPCRRSVHLHDEIYRCGSFHERAEVCERWLLRHLKPQPTVPFDHALALIYRRRGDIKIGRLAAEIGHSDRHVNRLFRRHTGLSAKTFIQTIRLQHVCKRLYVAHGDSLDTALDLGFFDQAHLIKDFRKHMLMAPRSFFERFVSDFYNQ